MRVMLNCHSQKGVGGFRATCLQLGHDTKVVAITCCRGRFEFPRKKPDFQGQPIVVLRITIHLIIVRPGYITMSRQGIHTVWLLTGNRRTDRHRNSSYSSPCAFSSFHGCLVAQFTRTAPAAAATTCDNNNTKNDDSSLHSHHHHHHQH